VVLTGQRRGLRARHRGHRDIAPGEIFAHRLDAVRAHLLEMAGNAAAARAGYQRAARATTSLPERRYLQDRAARLPG